MAFINIAGMYLKKTKLFDCDKTILTTTKTEIIQNL